MASIVAFKSKSMAMAAPPDLLGRIRPGGGAGALELTIWLVNLGGVGGGCPIFICLRWKRDGTSWPC